MDFSAQSTLVRRYVATDYGMTPRYLGMRGTECAWLDHQEMSDAVALHEVSPVHTQSTFIWRLRVNTNCRPPCLGFAVSPFAPGTTHIHTPFRQTNVNNAYMWQEMADPAHTLVIRPSTITGAGLGVFTTCEVDVGVLIGIFPVAFANVMSRDDFVAEFAFSPYALTWRKTQVIDFAANR